VLRTTARDPARKPSDALHPQIDSSQIELRDEMATRHIHRRQSKCCVGRCMRGVRGASSTMKDITIQPHALTRFRAAASEFAQSAKSRASRLVAVCDDIAALRAKGASFRTISELLGRCGIRASDTCVMRFCQRALAKHQSGHEKPNTALRHALLGMLPHVLLARRMVKPPDPPHRLRAKLRKSPCSMIC
jgi:hypothetical protein